MRPTMLSIYRRHRMDCPHRRKGRSFHKCPCPVWTEGTLHNKRYCRSLKTADWQKARRKADSLDSPDSIISKSVHEAVAAWELHIQVAQSTRRKYSQILRTLEAFCRHERIDSMDEFTVEVLDRFRANRKVARVTSIRELRTLRQFFQFALERNWIRGNPAKKIREPTPAPSRPIEPFTSGEIAAMIAACNQFGKYPYERLRARALLLLMRHTGLRISDAIMLSRDRVREGRITLFTQKTGGHIFLPVPKELSEALEMLPPPRGDGRDRGYFFWNGIISRRAALGVAERTLTRVFKNAGVRGAHAHRFRHTLATEILTRGGTEQDAADILGISASVVRKYYAKWTPQRQERIFSLMERIQAQLPSQDFTGVIQ